MYVLVPSCELPCSYVYFCFLYFPGDLFVPAFRCPHHLQRIGVVGDGGKWACGVARVAKQEKCVIYSFGLPPPLFPLPVE
jgi:hypothetical protein